MNPDRALDFLEFVQARHQAWDNRQMGLSPPWTEDRIIQTRKFTNVFRLLDPGSQFVISDLLSDDPPPVDFLARCFLYRHTNLPAAWRAYAVETGAYPTLADLDTLREFWHAYRSEGNRVFSGAYMIYPQSSVPGTNKIDSVIDLTRRMWEQSVFSSFLKYDTQRERFSVLRMNKGVADFMSMQILTDFGYSTEFRENDFVVPGPGARKGAAALEMKAEEAIEWGWNALTDNIYSVPLVEGRTLSRMDVQNCLCEFSKWVRLTPGPKPYEPAHPGPQPDPIIPPLWS